MPELAHRRGPAGGLPELVRTRRECGETLLEILISISLMSIGMLAVLTSLFTSSATAKLNTERTRVAVFLQNWGDRIIAPKLSNGTDNYVACTASLADANTAGLPSGWTASYKTEYLAKNGASNQPANWASLTWVDVNSCFNQGGDQGLQRVTLYVKSKPGKFQTTDSLVLIRRNPNCPSTFNNADLGPC
ncbi:type II secretion system protein [Jatrophihabitans sp.]|uniref:type IV pilus modification PilV family protein n=1 Tax=Jatrophihabitans sp. TaxID=1932789 RepID=UPI0030C6E1AE|nr:hypothetical protein [Jatrophihabitans sp.]